MEGRIIVLPAERNDDCGLQLDKNTGGATRHEASDKREIRMQTKTCSSMFCKGV